MLDREVVEMFAAGIAHAENTLDDLDREATFVPVPYDDFKAITAELIRVYRMWMEASVVKVERRTATFGHGDHGSQYVIGDDYMGTPAFNDLVGQRVRLVRDGEPGEGA